MVTTIALSFHHTIIFEDRKYMIILTRQEKERLVLDLYNQGKTYREISKEARISPRDIGLILNKVIEEKTEGLKEERQLQDNNIDAENNQEEQHSTLSTKAYKLFSDRKTPLEVAIELNLRESEATKLYKEYWNLKQLNDLNMVYEEIKGDIGYFLKLYKLAKAKGMRVQQVVDTLTIANNDLPSIEERFKRLRNDMSMIQSQKHTHERNLHQLNNQIAGTAKLLSSLRISCKRGRIDIENLYNEKIRIESVVTEFKNSDAEYLKLKQVAEDKVKSVLTNGKILLKFATGSVIESLRRNHELYNLITYTMSDTSNTTSYLCNYLSLISGEQQELFNYATEDGYATLVLEEAEKLYNELTTKLTNEIIAATATMKTTTSSLPLQLPSSDITARI